MKFEDIIDKIKSLYNPEAVAVMAVHYKKSNDSFFEQLLPIIRTGALDNRNFVKKSVNWALRQIGKRNLYLNSKAIETARQIQQLDTKCSRWIASNAILELRSQAVQNKLMSRIIV